MLARFSTILPLVLLALPALGVDLSTARAQSAEVSRDPDTGQVLHRRLPPSDGSDRKSTIFFYDPRQGGALPTEMERDGRRINAPEPDALPRPDELLHGRDGLTHAASGVDLRRFTSEASGTDRVVDPRSTHANQATPDRDTGAEGTLNYHSVFDPTVLPFKRNRSLNHITEDRVLRLARGRLTPLKPIGNRTQAGWEVFWGTLLIEASAGDEVPLPSVAPGSRILSFETVPPTEVTFLEDEADNVYIRPATDGRFRLVFVMDAPTEYFGRSMPEHLRLADVPDHLRPRPPRSLRRAARRAMKSAGIDDDLPYGRLLQALVTYFRDFEAGPLPSPTGDIYRDLVLAKKGICRHRTYGFVATALALGIPARYVLNEAHVFAEVWMPGRHSQWLRVDLGGDAERLVIHGGQGRFLHEPGARSPFSATDPWAGGDQAAGAQEVHGLPRPSAPANPSGGGSLDSAVVIPERLDSRIPRPRARPGQSPTTTYLEIDASMIYRGDSVPLRGQVEADPEGEVPTGRVQILLIVPETGQVIRLLALMDLDGAGNFEGDVSLPATLQTGRYDLVAEYMGDGRRAPSVSD